MSRIRWNLLFAMMAIVAFTIGLSALFTRRVTQEQVRRLLVARPLLDLQRAAAPLEEHYRQSGSWDGVDAAVERAAKQSQRRVVLTSPERKVIAISRDLRGSAVRVEPGNRVRVDTPVPARSPRFRQESRRRLLHMLIALPPVKLHDGGGRNVGSVYFLPVEKGERTVELREIAILDRSLILTFASATLIAILLTFLISRRITRPIERLTAVVDEMGLGKLTSRVPVTGDDEISRLARSFNAMADAVAKQEELRRRMVGDVAHELRTPLTNLRCEIESIQDGLATLDATRLGSLHDEVLHLSRLVDDLQELAVADGGGLQLHLERLDLAPVVARVVELFRHDARLREIAVDLSADDNIFIMGDAVRISQIVRNLLSNAIHHTPDRGSIHVRVTGAAGDGLISVADSGRGIPEVELERVFERFYRIDESRTRQDGGAGLGLSIVRRLAEMHGGNVRAESVVGQGARFVVTIPLASEA